MCPTTGSYIYDSKVMEYRLAELEGYTVQLNLAASLANSIFSYVSPPIAFKVYSLSFYLSVTVLMTYFALSY